MGEYIVIARHSGEDWYLGVMNANRPQELRVPLRFLGKGRDRTEFYADESQGQADQRLIRRTEEVAAQDVLKVSLASAGGYLARLTPLLKKAPKTEK